MMVSGADTSWPLESAWLNLADQGLSQESTHLLLLDSENDFVNILYHTLCYTHTRQHTCHQHCLATFNSWMYIVNKQFVFTEFCVVDLTRFGFTCLKCT
ncbi:hypothetical protein UPYG_G00118350 [Umbra pygmaea]|uniref:Uncharacterized protein n=1 Tax=Umbra pygmaea TaxID=75934 RepID=A0ABD0X820_UMBPY